MCPKYTWTTAFPKAPAFLCWLIQHQNSHQGNKAIFVVLDSPTTGAQLHKCPSVPPVPLAVSCTSHAHVMLGFHKTSCWDSSPPGENWLLQLVFCANDQSSTSCISNLISSYITTSWWSDLTCPNINSVSGAEPRSNLMLWSRDPRPHCIIIWKYFALCSLRRMKVNSPLAQQISVKVTDPPGILSFPQGKCISRGKKLVHLGNSQEVVQRKLCTSSHKIHGLVQILESILLKVFY